MKFFGFFISFASMLKGCRHIIELDGCFLKTIPGGLLLPAISIDPDTQMFPVGYAIVNM